MRFFSEHHLLGTAQTLTSESAHPPLAESPRKRLQWAGTSCPSTPADPGSLAPAPLPSLVCPRESSPCPGLTSTSSRSPASARTCPLGLTPQLQLTPGAGPRETQGSPTPGPLRGAATHSEGCAEGWLLGRGLAWRGPPGARRPRGRLREAQAAIRVGAGTAGQTEGDAARQLTYDCGRCPSQQGEECEEHGLVGVQDTLEEPGAICSPGHSHQRAHRAPRAVPTLGGRGRARAQSAQGPPCPSPEPTPWAQGPPRPSPEPTPWAQGPPSPSPEPTPWAQGPASWSREEAQLPPLQGHGAPKAKAMLKGYNSVTFNKTSGCPVSADGGEGSKARPPVTRSLARGGTCVSAPPAPTLPVPLLAGPH